MKTRFLYPSTGIPPEDYLVDKKLNLGIHKNATICPLQWYGWNDERNAGGVILEDGSYLLESAYPNRFMHPYPIDNFEYMDETVFYFGYFHKQWGHFLMECLTRLWPFVQNKYDITLIYLPDDKNSCIDGNYLELLNLFGIKKEQLKTIDKPVKFKEVIVPDASNYLYGWYTKEFASIFSFIKKKALQGEPENPTKKIFLRSAFKAKRDIGIEQIASLFHENKYEYFYPEKFHVVDQIKRIYYAKEIAVHQSSLAHNLIFCNENTKITIFNRNAQIDGIQARIMQMMNLQNYFFVDTYQTILPFTYGKGPFCFIPNQILYDYVTKILNFEHLIKFDTYKLLKEYIESYKEIYLKNENLEYTALDERTLQCIIKELV